MDLAASSLPHRVYLVDVAGLWLPPSLPALFQRAVATTPGALGACQRGAHGRWDGWTWRRWSDVVARLAARLRAEGVGPGQRIHIVGLEGREQETALLAALHLGAVVSDPTGAERLLELTPAETADAAPTGPAPRLPDDWRGLGPNDPALALGAQTLSHGQLGFTVAAVAERLDEGPGELERLPGRSEVVSPARNEPGTVVWGLWSAAARWAHGRTAFFCPPEPARWLSELRQVRPTHVLAPVELWGELRAAVEGHRPANPTSPFARALRLGRALVQEQTPDTWRARWQRWRDLGGVLARARHRVLGDRLRRAACWPPLTPDDDVFWQALGVRVHQLWGLAETAGPWALDGRPLRGCEAKQDGDRLRLWGPGVAAESATASGQIAPDGTLRPLLG